MPDIRLPTSRAVHVRFTKWDGSLHWHFDTTLVGRDEHGTWLLVAPNGRYQRGDEAPRTDAYGFVVLIPDGGWWTAYFNAVPHAIDDHVIYVDINTPARWEGDSVHMVDLDLDVTLSADGTVAVLDEDEFIEHSTRFAYPGDVVAATRGAAAAIHLAISRRQEPFDSLGFARVASELGWGHGVVVSGHGVASGRTVDERFPDGTLALQFPHFRTAGIPLDGLRRATLNVASQFPLRPRRPRWRLPDLEWLRGYPRETFEFFEARIAHDRTVYDAVVYRPDPATKPDFPHPEEVIEILAPPIQRIAPGAAVSVWLNPDQATFQA